MAKSIAEKPKRTNKARFLSEEVEVMVGEIEKRSKLLFCKHNGGGGTNTKKIHAWQEVTDAVNAVSIGPVRTVNDIKLKWKDQKRLAKLRLVENRKEVIKTGGGPGPDDVDPFLERMAALTGEASISGIPGGGLEIGFGEPMEDGVITVIVPPATPPRPEVSLIENDVDIVHAVRPILQNRASQTTTSGNDYMAAHLAQGERLIDIHREQVQATNRLAAVLESLVRGILDKQ